MEKLKDKIEKYINNTGVIKTPAYFIKEILVGIIDRVEDVIELISETVEYNIIPYVQNKIIFDTEELNIDTKNGYYYTLNLLENFKITKIDDTICPKVEFNGYCVKLQLPKDIALQNKYVDFEGFAKYIINFDNNNCKIDKYTWDLSEYLIATYLDGTTELSYNNSLVFESLNRNRLLMTTGPVYENERLITKVGTTIGSSTFWNCADLVSITIPNSVISIGEEAFSNCLRLTSIIIGNNVTSIGEWAFASCYALASITIPNSVTYIGDYAFYGCSHITSITIPNSVTSIGLAVFNECQSLTYITIPNSVTSIGFSAFNFCKRLTSITIPDSVTSIGDYVFQYCSELASVTIDSTTPPTLGSGVFTSTSSSLQIYVPDESVNAYKSATNWKSYSSKIKPLSQKPV